MAVAPWLGWMKPNLWPERSPPGHIFLAEAFNIIGGILFADWTGHEVEDATRELPAPIPAAHDAFDADGKPKYGIHLQYGPAVLSKFKGYAAPVDQGMWDAVASDAQRVRAQVLSARMRRDLVASTLYEWAVAGDLRFAARAKLRGGALTPIDPVEWEIDWPWVPFSTLGYDVNGGLCSLNSSHWLFVTEQSLKAVIEGQGEDASQPLAPAEELPPSAPRRVRQDRVEKWFKETRVPEFEGKSPPDWRSCWDAAKANFAPDRVVREVLLEARRVATPSSWQKPGPNRSSH